MHFMVANYMLGNSEDADRALRAMLHRQQNGGLKTGVKEHAPEGAERETWDGRPCRYEVYRADVYSLLQTVLLREPDLRNGL
jgi:hypothetical protein